MLIYLLFPAARCFSFIMCSFLNYSTPFLFVKLQYSYVLSAVPRRWRHRRHFIHIKWFLLYISFNRCPHSLPAAIRLPSASNECIYLSPWSQFDSFEVVFYVLCWNIYFQFFFLLHFTFVSSAFRGQRHLEGCFHLCFALDAVEILFFVL